MDEEDFIDLDSDKEVWLLNIGAFRQWQIDRFNDNGDKRVKRLPKKQLYQRLHREALELYNQLYQEAQDLPHNVRIRLFRYLSGETMEEIAESENPPVTRQAIQKDLKRALKTMSVRQARQIWFYRQHYSKLSKPYR